MQNKSQLQYNIIVFIVIAFYGFLLGKYNDLTFINFIFAIPLVLYIYKYKINSFLIISSIIVLLLQTLYFSYTSGLVFLGVFLIPSFLLGHMFRLGNSLSYTIMYVTLITFMIVIILITAYDKLENQHFIEGQTNRIIEEYKYNIQKFQKQVPKISVNNNKIYELRDILETYFISFIFIGVFLNILLISLLSRLIMNILEWKKFSINSLITYNPPRHFLFFYVLLQVMATVVKNKSLLMAIKNINIISSVFIIGIGLLFVIFIILKTSSIAAKIALIFLTVYYLFSFLIYFIGIGIIEILVRLRNKTVLE